MFIIVAVLTFLFLTWVRPPTVCSQWGCDASAFVLIMYSLLAVLAGSLIQFVINMRRRNRE